MDKKLNFSLWDVVLALVALVTVQGFVRGNHTHTLTYREFKQALSTGRVDDIALKERVATATVLLEREVVDRRMLDGLLRAAVPAASDTGAQANVPVVAA